jgi:ubiquinone/menaquinone biosynthesis C-methylase UbiE
MKQGDFSSLAKDYVNRPGYSLLVLNNLSSYVGACQKDFLIADIGAGTGKLNENLLELNYENIIAVEPNDDMRAEGIKVTGNKGVKWLVGSGEETTLDDESVNWVLMASSFHWTDPQRSLPEFKRILKPGGFLTVLWNPRDLENNLLQKKIDKLIYQISPEITRVSSGSVKYTEGIEKTLVSTGDFTDVIFVESLHEVVMSKERYMGAWRSVNDIQAQAGPEKFKEILNAIEKEIRKLSEIIVLYKTRSWTSQVIK